jgi:hypothetical protein
MKSYLALACAGALLAACSTPGQVRLDAGKALAGAELAVTGANTAATAAARSGACKAACAAKAQGLLERANACVAAAYTAYSRADVSTAAATLTTCFGRLAEAQSALEGK